MIHGSPVADHFPTPPIGSVPGAPASCQGSHRASSTFRWSVGDTGDPAELVANYLSANGLAVRDLRRTATQVHPDGCGTVCGAALYVSAAAGSVMVGGPPGASSPVPSIPDVSATVFTHGDPAPAGSWRPGSWRLGRGGGDRPAVAGEHAAVAGTRPRRTAAAC
jgi:para-aminobenzoate synthetase component 1